MDELTRKRRIGLSAAIATALCWSFLAIFLKFSLSYADAYTIVWYRMCVAFVILTAWLIGTGQGKQLEVLKIKPGLLLVAAFSLAFNYIGFMQGVNFTSPVNAQVFIQTGPLLLALSGIIIFKEKLSKTQSLGFVFCLIGFGFFFSDRLSVTAGDDGRFFIGMSWLAFAAITWALFAILQKKLLVFWKSSQINVYIYLLSTLLFIPFVDWQRLTTLPLAAHGFFIFLGFNTLLAYGCLSVALRYLPATQVSPIITLNPLLTLVLINIIAWMDWTFIPADPIGISGYFGALLAIFGIIFVLTKRPTRKVS